MKQKIFTLLFAVAVSMGTMYAENVLIGDLYYILNDENKTAELTSSGGDKYSSDIVIPASVEYNEMVYSVTIIRSYAFQNCSSLTSVTIPNSVTVIGNAAFSGCTGLTSVTIGNSVTSIRSYTFNYCPSLTSVTIPNSVTSIERYAFENCTGLTSVTIPNSVTYIGLCAFRNCTSLASITIPNSVTSIDINAFSNCSSLTSVTLDADAIVNKAYKSSSSIKDIFGAQVREYIIGNSVTNIGDYAFYDCGSLNSLIIPNSVTSIGSLAFYRCTGLTSLTIPNSVISIAGGAFEGCYSVMSLTIPNSVTSIEAGAFSGCSALFSVSLDADALLNTFSSVADIFGTQVREYTIGNSVTSIGAVAFQDCPSLTSVIIGNNVTSIGIAAFNFCTSLTSVTIGNSVTYIGDGAFWNCNSLNSITCYATKPPELGDDVFYVYCPYVPLYVPNESVALYRETDVWKDFNIRLLRCVVNASASHGIVEGTGEYKGYSNITLKVIPENGYIFTRWSDGYVFNPRTITVEHDTVLTAICEEYQKPVNTDLPYNEPFTSNIGRFSISDINADGLSYVWKWASADYGMKATAYVNKTSHAAESWLISPPISLLNASNIVLSFQHAVNKGTPTNLSVKISTDLGTTWRDLSISNWPAGSDWTFISASESLDAYADNIVQIAFVYVSTSSDCPTWEIKNFSITGTIGVDPGEPMPITVDASETTAAVSWLQVFNGVTYELIIYGSNWNVIYVMVFDSEGHLLNITNDAPARDKSSQQEQTGGFAYTIAGLNSGTEYNYMLVAKDNTDKMVTSYSGSFKTTGSATALEEVDDHLLHRDPTQCTKVIRDGQIYILRGEKVYTLQGQEVK